REEHGRDRDEMLRRQLHPAEQNRHAARGAPLHDEPADKHAGRWMRMDRIPSAGGQCCADISSAERDGGGSYTGKDGRGCRWRAVRILQDARHVRWNVEKSEVARVK